MSTLHMRKPRHKLRAQSHLVGNWASWVQAQVPESALLPGGSLATWALGTDERQLVGKT